MKNDCECSLDCLIGTCALIYFIFTSYSTLTNYLFFFVIYRNPEERKRQTNSDGRRAAIRIELCYLVIPRTHTNYLLSIEFDCWRMHAEADANERWPLIQKPFVAIHKSMAVRQLLTNFVIKFKHFKWSQSTIASLHDEHIEMREFGLELISDL